MKVDDVSGASIGLALAASVVVIGVPQWSARAAGSAGLEEITVTAPGIASGAPDTATEGTVLPQQLEERPVYREGELLESVPGLIVTQHSGEGKANQYFLRGFNLDHGTDISITLDDMPVNMRTHAHGQGYSDLNFMFPELVRGIEYAKGPYFASTGDFDTAGAVNIAYVDTLPHDIASASGGTLGDERAFVAGSRPVGAGNLLVAAESSHADGPWTVPDNFNKGNVLLRYGQGTPANGFSLTAMYMNDAFHATNQIPERAVAEGLIGQYGAIDETDGGSSERYSLSAKYVDTEEARQIRANVYFIGYSLQLFNDFDYYLVALANPLLIPPGDTDQFEQQDRRKIVGANYSYTRFDTMFGRDAEDTVGFQTRTDDIHLELNRATDQVPFLTVRDDKVDEVSGGLYGESRVQWLDKFRTVAGLREDVFYGTDRSTLAANSGTTGKGLFSPKVNAILGPWANTELFMSYGQGFHSNDLRGAVSTVDSLQSILSNKVVAQPKTPLLTRAEGYEAGARTELVPHLELEAALFELDLANEATFDGDEAVTTPGRPSVRRGVELSAFYRPLAWLIVDGDVAFTRARYAAPDPCLDMAAANCTTDTESGHPGSYIPGAAKLIAAAGIGMHDLGPWDGGLRFRYFGPRPLIEDNSVTSGPTALFDLRVGYRLTDTIRLGLDIYNLFNSHAHQIDYYYASQLPGEPNPVYDIHYKPVEPLSARFSVAMQF
jgi:outer membrane receptor protein involved in Fe transport